MIEHSLRPLYQRLLVNLPAQWISRYVRAVHITILSGILGILVVPFMMKGWVGLAMVCLVLSGYCDTLDGTIARIGGQSSEWGAVIDICTDRLVEFSVIFSLWVINPSARALWAILMLGAILLCITSFLVVGIFSENHSNKSFHYSPGLMERAEAFIFFIAMMLWPSAFVLLASVFCLLVLWTTVIRLREFYHQFSQQKK